MYLFSHLLLSWRLGKENFHLANCLPINFAKCWSSPHLQHVTVWGEPSLSYQLILSTGICTYNRWKIKKEKKSLFYLETSSIMATEKKKTKKKNLNIGLNVWVLPNVFNYMITPLKQQPRAYQQKLTPGAALGVPLSAEELQKVTAESVWWRCWLPGPLSKRIGLSC